jgi:hypothetical protein
MLRVTQNSRAESEPHCVQAAGGPPRLLPPSQANTRVTFLVSKPPLNQSMTMLLPEKVCDNRFLQLIQQMASAGYRYSSSSP